MAGGAYEPLEVAPGCGGVGQETLRGFMGKEKPQATPRGDMGTPESPHTAEHGVGTAFFLPFWRRAATVRTGLSPHPNGRRRWEAAGMAEGRPPRRSLHCHAPSLCHPNAALPVPARFRGDEGAIVVQAVKMDSESTWTRARAGDPGNGKQKGWSVTIFHT